MADRYRGSRYDRGDESNRGMFGYEGEGYVHGGGRDDRDYSSRLYGGRDTGRYNDELAGFRGTGYLGGDYGQVPRTDRERGGWWGERDSGDIEQRPSYRGRGPKNYQRSDERIREDVC